MVGLLWLDLAKAKDEAPVDKFVITSNNKPETIAKKIRLELSLRSFESG